MFNRKNKDKSQDEAGGLSPHPQPLSHGERVAEGRVREAVDSGLSPARKRNRGQVLVLVALSLVVFIGFAALAIDVAYFYHTKNQLQGAADAAALAGAAKLDCEDSDDPDQEDARKEAWKYACKNKAAGENVYLEEDGTNCDAPPEDLDDISKGDIEIGHWTGSAFKNTSTPVNAVRVRARRTTASETYGMGPIKTFFGGIFNIKTVNISAKATSQGCFPNITPIAVNEYWMGKRTGDCNDQRQSDPKVKPDGSPTRSPYGIDHVYPNSFVRMADSNVGPSGFFNFSTADCRAPGTIAVTANGPLPSGWPPDNKGRPGSRTGRVFAIVGEDADPNLGSQNLNSLIDLNYRIGCSAPIGCTDQQWYIVSGEQFIAAAPNKADSNPDKDIVAGYIRDGKYRNIMPTSVPEVYQSGYTDRTPYTQGPPYASISYPSGLGIWGNMVKDNFYPYSKYAVGNKINVLVYDGIVGDSGNQQRTTIVGFARIKIFRYGKELSLGADGTPVIINPDNPQTMYGYVEDAADSLKPRLEDLEEPYVADVSILVQ